MSAPRIVGKNYTDATRFARETLGLAPHTFRVTTTVGGLAGRGYTLHLAPGWSKAPYSHALRNKIKFKRGIEVIDHEATVQKESTRKIEDAPDISTLPGHAPDSDPHGFHSPTAERLHLADGDEMPIVAPNEPEDGIDRDSIGHAVKSLGGAVEAVNLTGKPEVITPPEGWRDMGHITEETDEPTGTPQPSKDAEGAKEPKRRKRRCKKCGVLIHPDDVEAHAAEHEAE